MPRMHFFFSFSFESTVNWSGFPFAKLFKNISDDLSAKLVYSSEDHFETTRNRKRDLSTCFVKKLKDHLYFQKYIYMKRR